MKKIICMSLVTLVSVSLLGCGSSASSAPAEPQTKEPELKEIEISLDNWQDYFDVSYVLNKETATDPESFYEEDLGKEYYSSYSIVLGLRDEYKDKLAMDQQSLIKITCDIEQAYFDVSIQNGEMVLGDYHPSIVDESSGLTGMEHGMGGYPSAENLEREGWDSFGYEVAEDGKVVHIVNLTDKGYSTAEIADGIKLISPQFSRETYLDESGNVWCIKDISDDAIFAVMKDRKIDWKAFEGKLYIYE